MVEVAPGVMKRFTDVARRGIVGAKPSGRSGRFSCADSQPPGEKIRRRLKSGERIPTPDWTQWFDEGPRSQATDTLTLRAHVHELSGRRSG